jgi:carbon-monoxide dehydrogenase catalytic subunit
MSDAEKAMRKVSIDPTVEELRRKAAADGCELVFDRVEEGQKSVCQFGAQGVCCRLCAQGPCRITKKAPRGVCGATAETVVARNFCRMIAAGSAAHNDHGRNVANLFRKVAKQEISGYEIKDRGKLYELALDLGVDLTDKDDHQVALEVADKILAEFGQQEGEIHNVRRAPLKRQELWRKLGVIPRGLDREVTEMLVRTHMGVDQDYRNLMLQATRTALSDGWGGSMFATDLQDVMFGTPAPIAGEMNLGALKKDQVNIVVHGHEPLLPEMMVTMSQKPELIAKAKAAGAAGINLTGMCCSANEVMARRGIAVAGNFLQQELAIVTGAVDLMTVDVQCIMESLAEVAHCYHTKLVTTDRRAKIPGAIHVEFDEDHAAEIATRLIEMAIANYKERDPNKVLIPAETTPIVTGFSMETISYLLGGTFRASYRPLNDNIIGGRIRGVAGVVGCNNARTMHDDAHSVLVRELIKNDVIVLSTGCAAVACGKLGYCAPEAAAKYAGPGLSEVCEAVGIPPVLHMGACVDNTRILMAATAMVKEGGLGDDISDLPAAGAAPEWMSEKAIAIGQYFVAAGVYTVFGVTFPTGSEKFLKHLFEEHEEMYGGRWDFEPDPEEMATKMIAHIDKKRKALGLDRARERALFDMAMRRDLE